MGALVNPDLVELLRRMLDKLPPAGVNRVRLLFFSAATTIARTMTVLPEPVGATMSGLFLPPRMTARARSMARFS